MSTPVKKLTDEESVARRAAIREVYRTGDTKRAAAMSNDFYAEHPEDIRARYCHAVMNGDYGGEPGHEPSESARLKEIAKVGISALYHDPAFASWPLTFRMAVQNEYYWFFEMHREQYELGMNKTSGTSGDLFSACVGSCMLAWKHLREGQLQEAESWAKTSLKIYEEFMAEVKDWYSVHYFSSRPLAILGRYEEAAANFMLTFGDGPEKPERTAKFAREVEEIKAQRLAAQAL